MPGLIFERADFDEPNKKTNKSEPRYIYDNYPNSASRLLMWSGVGALTLCIFIMWIWNARVMVGGISGEKNSAIQIVDTAKADLGTMLKSVTEKEHTAAEQNDRQNMTNDSEENKPEAEQQDKWQKFLYTLLQTATGTPSTTAPETTPATEKAPTGTEISEEEAAMLNNARINDILNKSAT